MGETGEGGGLKMRLNMSRRENMALLKQDSTVGILNKNIHAEPMLLTDTFAVCLELVCSQCLVGR